MTMLNPGDYDSPPPADFCPGHPCEDDADRYPHAGIGDLFYCDGSCAAAVEARMEYDPDETGVDR